ncbi:hypothetical protein D9619_013054 [Psilocybe cf. subviscida]|uniref:FCP1 homology domain-containing protein n=1 Tax=Psilocybe cf. subviscida TaxID=2480587 RepID=A0A8H5EV94_9AGAR|nr:hypothetical protein D9619_013054 [Psilocybe cf. subviscida]
MCANRGKSRQNHDNHASGRQQTQSNVYSDYGNYAHYYGAEGSAVEGAGMSYGQQVEGQWFYNQPGYNGLGPWAAGYDQGPYANLYANGGYEGLAYTGGPQGYQGQQAFDHHDAQQQYNGGYSTIGQGANSGYGEFVNGEQGGNINSGYSSYSTRPDSGSYSNYRRGSNRKVHHQQSRGYASEVRQRAGMPSDPTTTTPGSPRATSSPRRTPPPPPRRKEPTEEYLNITQNPSSHVEDPSSARKLVVLDLNGSLLLRSAHQRRPLQPRSGHYSRDNDDPYADPTKLRPLRAVHRRPYLGAFTSYILHDKTKDWLDTMVWSSAQPHSVDDMVDRCFGERRSELRAVWARDTLGLAAHDYNKKSLTLKDLAKPWAELPYYSTSPSAAASSPPEETETEALDAQHHSALSTVLVDDSPLKAMLQPWNHLVIHEYLQQTRNLDLKVLEWEEAKERMKKTQQDIEALESATGEAAPGGETAAQVEEVIPDVDAGTSLNENVQADPSSDAPEATESEVPSGQAAEGLEVPIAEDTFIPNAKRRKKKLAKQEKLRQERQEKQRQAFAALRDQQQAALAERLALAQANGQVPANVKLPKHDVGKPTDVKVEVELKYDETLLAVVGVLDHLKHETSVSGWMRSGGLINTALAGSQPSSSDNAVADPSSSPLQPSTKHDAPSRGSSPSEYASPSKKRRIESSPALDTDIDTASAENPSPIAAEPPLSQISTTVQSSPPPSDEQADTGVPLSAPVPTVSAKTEKGGPLGGKHTVPSTAGAAGLWYEDKAVLNYWAGQGRKALAELGIEADSGMRTASR